MKILPNNIAVLENDDWVSRWIQETGRLDHDQNSLPQILPFIKEGDAVIDIGAFVGDHTHAYLERVGETGTVLAFEPNPKAYECLRHNCPAAISMCIALSDQIGFMGLDDAGSNPGATCLVPGQGVRTAPLDSFLLGKISLCKIDCEGCELKVLRGARQTIAKFRPILVVEINRATLARHNTTPEEVFDELKNMHYLWRNIYESEPMSGPQYDIIAFPQSVR